MIPRLVRVAAAALIAPFCILASAAAVSAASPTPPTFRPNLSLTKTVNPATVLLGGTVTWTITVSNGPGRDADLVRVVDMLPAGLTFSSSTSSVPGAIYDPVTGKWTLTSGLPVGASATLTISTITTATGTLKNCATLLQIGKTPLQACASTIVTTPPTPTPSSTPTPGSTPTPTPSSTPTSGSTPTPTPVPTSGGGVGGGTPTLPSTGWQS